MTLSIFELHNPTLENQWAQYLKDASYILLSLYSRSVIGSCTSVKLKVMFDEQLQSLCRRVNFDLTVLDSKRTFHLVFYRHYLDIKHTG